MSWSSRMGSLVIDGVRFSLQVRGEAGDFLLKIKVLFLRIKIRGHPEKFASFQSVGSSRFGHSDSARCQNGCQ